MILVITGPTGVGKTKLSIELAKTYNAEIINADSMQVYKELNIGTAKIKDSEKENIKHHLFDIKEVTDNYTVFDYQKDGRLIINKLLKENKNIIIVGGTGLYIKALLYDYTFTNEVNNNNYENVDTKELYNRLLLLDKDVKIDPHNKRRLIRALNYYQNNNKSINENNSGNNLVYPNAIFIGLTTDRETLYNKINSRVDKMIEEGLITEVRCLYAKNIKTKPIINGIGYKELYSYFNNEISYDDAINLIKRNSRRYAKRQYTFFNNKMNIKYFNTNYDDFSKTVEEVKKHIERLT